MRAPDNRGIVRRCLLPTLLLVALLFSACAQASHPAAPSPRASPTSGLPAPPPLRWTACQGAFQCASLTVPVDYAHPGQATIALAMIRLPAATPSRRIGSLLTDPGGPGGSGIDFVRGASDTVLAPYHDRFDIVGFDPRGGGDSQPVHCLDAAGTDSYLQLDQVPDDPAERAALVDANQRYGAACEAKSGALLPHLAAEVVARDMEEMRIALGDARLTYMGLSYGSLLGATYAELFPTHVRALDLDGVVDPNQSIEGFIRGQAIGYDDALTRFLAACRGGGCTFNADRRGREKLTALTAAVDRTPLRSGTRSIGPGGLAYAVAEGLTSPARWNSLSQALSLAVSGDGRGIVLFYDAYTNRHPDGTFSNLLDVYNAVTCVDRPAPPRIEDFDRIAADLKATAPYFGASTTYESLPCLYWPVRATGRAHPIKAPGTPPILVVGATHDPATPYAWARNLAGQLQSGILLTRDGDGHTSIDKSRCIDDAVAAYLVELRTPPPGTTCGSGAPPLQPTPQSA
ncbi:MAG: alpha/beta hydrolase [Candidatus Dormibacteraeota bacterium]|nr:alpha/beta hydrolase [Candidatus Dormibacteraeota bacterium]